MVIIKNLQEVLYRESNCTIRFDLQCKEQSEGTYCS